MSPIVNLRTGTVTPNSVGKLKILIVRGVEPCMDKRVTLRPEAWERLQRELGTQDPNPGQLTVLLVAGDRSSLRGYVYLGLPYCWQKIEDLGTA